MAWPNFADAIAGCTAHLRHERKHAAQHLAQWRDVVLRNPGGQFHELSVEDRLLIKHCFDRPRLDWRRFIVQAGDYADQFFVAERKQQRGRRPVDRLQPLACR